MKKDKPSKHRPIRNPIVKALIAKPKRNSGKHRSKPNNVRNRVVDVEGYE